MKKLLVTVIMIISASAANALTVKYPQDACHEIMSQEYSTGGGDTSWHFVEILCKDKDGKYKGFVTRFGNAAGFFGFGRLSTPEVIEYVPYDGNTLSVE